MARELTGPKVAAMVVGFFAVIVGVNLYMATKAISTFPGVEAKNTYYASQNFEAARQSQMALGWTVSDQYQDGELRITVTDKAGNPAPIVDFQVLIGRTTEQNQDQTPVFAREGADWIAPVALAPGKWMLRVAATAADGTTFRQQRNLRVQG